MKNPALYFSGKLRVSEEHVNAPLDPNVFLSFCFTGTLMLTSETVSGPTQKTGPSSTESKVYFVMVLSD